MNSQKAKASSLIGIVVGLGSLVTFSIVFSFMVRQAAPITQGTTSARDKTSAGTHSPTNFLQERVIAETAVMQTQLALIKTITPDPPPTGRPPTITPAPFIPGIFDVSSAPFGVPQAYAISSLWKDIINGERVLVYAGARRDISGVTPDKTQGIVVVQVYSRDLSNKKTVEYEAPGATGILRIIAVTRYRLTLQGQNSEILYFDVPSRQFVNKLTVINTAPTATLLPPATPTKIAPDGSPPPGYP